MSQLIGEADTKRMIRNAYGYGMAYAVCSRDVVVKTVHEFHQSLRAEITYCAAFRKERMQKLLQADVWESLISAPKFSVCSKRIQK
ncbi:MAG TPA: hypothetical protein VGZ00_01190 [Candidatus Baltobacteraceae bacterium]|jgi:hypothetical protein|nr:hypothetical protein [Candidatus Baltobacteraceae bacterium]